MTDSTPTLERSLRDRLLGAEKGARENGLYAYANLFRDARAALDASGNDELVEAMNNARPFLRMLSRFGEDSVWRPAEKHLAAFDAAIARTQEQSE